MTRPSNSAPTVPPSPGDLRVWKKPPQENSRKIVYAVQQCSLDDVMGKLRWRGTMVRLEWFPRIKTWRIIRSVQVSPSRIEPHTLADLGDMPEEDAVSVALSTVTLMGAV